MRQVGRWCCFPTLCFFSSAPSPPTLFSLFLSCLPNPPSHAAILDEAHRLKSRSSATRAALLELNVHWMLLLSGTPVQNNMKELQVGAVGQLLACLVCWLGQSVGRLVSCSSNKHATGCGIRVVFTMAALGWCAPAATAKKGNTIFPCSRLPPSPFPPPPLLTPFPPASTPGSHEPDGP